MTPATRTRPQPKLNQKCHDCPHIWGDHVVSRRLIVCADPDCPCMTRTESPAPQIRKGIR